MFSSKMYAYVYLVLIVLRSAETDNSSVLDVGFKSNGFGFEMCVEEANNK